MGPDTALLLGACALLLTLEAARVVVRWPR